MSGLTFLNTGFWPWLLALSIPVAIHLLTRQTRRVYVLPTFQFLQKSAARQSRVFRLRQWLLLTLRLLAVLFLVLTFLKPTTFAPLGSAGGTKRAVVLVLDTSLSMGWTRGGVSTLAQTRGQAGALLEDLRGGDVANVILAGASPHPVLPQIGGDFGTLRQVVQTAQPTAERGDLPAAIALAAEQLAKSDAPRKELLLASDFQRTNWAAVKFDALPADVRLVFLGADAGERDNSAVIGLKLEPAAPRIGDEARIVAEVWNGANSTRTLPVTLTVQLDDSSAGTDPPQTWTQNVTAPAYASGTTNFPVTFDRVGRYRITARVPADSLPADDTRYLVADLRHGLTVLLLTDADVHSPRTAAFYLNRALNPDPDSPGGLRVLVRRGDQLTPTDLKSCDVVLMDEVSALPADRLPLLARYVVDGGSLMVFLTGAHIQDQMLAFAQAVPRGEGLPFLPQSAIDVRQRGKGYVTLTEAKYDSPLLTLFKDPGVADLGSIHFTRFFLTQEPDSRTETLLKFEDGTPAVARRGAGAGSVLLCNFSPLPADSDLARQEVFPPLLHEFVKGMTQKSNERREFTPGGPASTTLDAAQSRGNVTATGPDGAPERVTADRTGGVIIETTTLPGFHEIRAGGQTVATLAVNPHPDESDLRPLDPRELEARRSQRAAYAVRADSGASAVESLRRGRPLWPYCLLAAFAALILEQFVATFGSSARIRPST